VATSIQELTYELSLGALNQQESALNANREVCEENQVTIDGLVRVFKWACLALVAAVGLWTLGLAIQ
jgi:hypothetical protein